MLMVRVLHTDPRRRQVWYREPSTATPSEGATSHNPLTQEDTHEDGTAPVPPHRSGVSPGRHNRKCKAAARRGSAPTAAVRHGVKPRAGQVVPGGSSSRGDEVQLYRM